MLNELFRLDLSIYAHIYKVSDLKADTEAKNDLIKHLKNKHVYQIVVEEKEQKERYLIVIDIGMKPADKDRKSLNQVTDRKSLYNNLKYESIRVIKNALCKIIQDYTSL